MSNISCILTSKKGIWTLASYYSVVKDDKQKNGRDLIQNRKSLTAIIIDSIVCRRLGLDWNVPERQDVMPWGVGGCVFIFVAKLQWTCTVDNNKSSPDDTTEKMIHMGRFTFPALSHPYGGRKATTLSIELVHIQWVPHLTQISSKRILTWFHFNKGQNAPIKDSYILLTSSYPFNSPYAVRIKGYV